MSISEPDLQKRRKGILVTSIFVGIGIWICVSALNELAPAQRAGAMPWFWAILASTTLVSTVYGWRTAGARSERRGERSRPYELIGLALPAGALFAASGAHFQALGAAFGTGFVLGMTLGAGAVVVRHSRTRGA